MTQLKKTDAVFPIISLVSLKGGVGKTTSTIHLATSIWKSDQPVVVLDADAQSSALNWANAAQNGALTGKGSALPFQVLKADSDRLAAQAKELSKTAYVLIDTPPNQEKMTLTGAGVADFVIVPVAPTAIEIDRLISTAALLTELENIRGALNVGILIIKFRQRNLLSQEALKVLKAFPVLDSKIRMLSAYESSFGSTPEYLDEYNALLMEIEA